MKKKNNSILRGIIISSLSIIIVGTLTGLLYMFVSYSQQPEIDKKQNKDIKTISVKIEEIKEESDRQDKYIHTRFDSSQGRILYELKNTTKELKKVTSNQKIMNNTLEKVCEKVKIDKPYYPDDISNGHSAD